MIDHHPSLDNATRTSLAENYEAMMQIAECLSKGSQGFDRSFIKKLPSIRSKYRLSHSQTWCVVCMTEFQDKDMLRILPSCNHEFHRKCVDKWLKMKKTCPVCRQTVRAESPDPFSM